MRAKYTAGGAARTGKFAITVLATADGDLAWYGVENTAPAMEDRVTELHREYPAPMFRVEVKSI